MNRFTLTLFVLFTGLNVLFAQDAGMKPLKDATALKAKLKESSQAINTIEADFTQKKHLSFMAEDVTTSGHFSFKQQNKIRWEYLKPYKYVVVINGSDIYLKDDEKVSHFDSKSNKMFQGINDMMMAIVRGDVLTTGDFSAAYHENDKYYFVKLTPVKSQMKSYLKTIDIWFDKKDMSVSKLKLTELSDDYTYIEYQNKQLNKPLNDAIFSVK